MDNMVIYYDFKTKKRLGVEANDKEILSDERAQQLKDKIVVAIKQYESSDEPPHIA